MPTLFLHVGQGKTGSSFLQAAFAASAGALFEAGIRYPAHAGGHERALSGGVTSGNGALLANAFAGEEQLTALLGDGAGADLLFSREQLSYELLRDGVLEHLERAGHTAGFDRISVLLFIRDPVEHASSDYSQKVKRKRSRDSIEDHFRTCVYPENAALMLTAIAQRPTIDVTVRNYSRVRDGLLDCTAEWLGIDSAQLARPAVERINRALTPDELRLVRRLNEVSEVAGRLVADRLCEALPQLTGPAPVPPRAVQEEMLARLRPAIEAVDRRIDIEHRYRLATAVPMPVDDGEIRLSEDQVEVIAGALAGALQSRDEAIRDLSARVKSQADRIGRQHERIAAQGAHVENISRKLRERDLALAVSRGELALERGRSADAARLFEQALALAPSRTDVRALLDRARAKLAGARPPDEPTGV